MGDKRLRGCGDREKRTYEDDCHSEDITPRKFYAMVWTSSKQRQGTRRCTTSPRTSSRKGSNTSLEIKPGSFVTLLGPSGCGKTTTLRMIAGFESPDEGEIYIDGKRVNDIPAAKRGIGFVFQNYALFRYMTVYENVAFGLELQKMPKKQIKETS